MPQCQSCGGELSHIEEYDRWYCYDCERYAPKEEAPAAGARPCPICRGDLKYVQKFDRWFCDRCQEYAPQEERFCPTCDGPLAYVKEYERWYCYSCETYPKVEEEAAPVVAEGEEPEEEEAAEEEAEEEAVPEEEETAAEEAEEELPPIDVKRLRQMSKLELVGLAKAHGLSYSGTKAKISERLTQRAETLAAEAEEEEVVPEEEAAEEEEAPEEEVPAEEAEAPEEEVEAPGEEEEVPEEEVAEPVEAEAPPEAEAVEEPPAKEEVPVRAAPVEKAPPKVAVVKPIRVKKAEAACPTCAGTLEYIKEYGRHYCYSCGNYAPKSMTAKLLAAPAAKPRVAKVKVKTCPTCRRPLSYIQQYEAWYCYDCEAYPKEEVKRGVVRERAVEKPCPTCGAELTYIPEYRRDYCYSCGNYAPKAKPVVKKVAAAKAAPKAAPPAALARPGLAFAATVQLVVGFVMFLVSSILTLLVGAGVVGEFYLYQGSGFVITAYGPLSGVLMTASATPQAVNSFNILLFIAALFGAVGILAFVISFLPKRK
jgi:chemotaxis protein histidine kinase CheA